jgi:DNA repair exonuclease SbcCD nuclease subunit
MAKLKIVDSEFLLITDTHLKKDNYHIVLSIVKQAIKICLERKISKIYHLGDFFTSRNAQPLEVLLEAQSIFQLIQDAGLQLFIIPGNHDKTDLTSDNSYLDVFKEKIFNLHSTPYFYQVEENVIHAFLPYYKENTEYKPKLEKLISDIKENYSKSIKVDLFTHIATNGVKNNDGSEVENDLDPNLFNFFRNVFTGHYHNRSTVGKNIYYMGSAYQANYGEDAEKGFVILNSDGSFKYINSAFPKYIKVQINATDDKRVIKAKIDEAKKEPGNNVRFVVEGTKEECEAFDKSKFIEQGIDIKFDKQVLRNQEVIQEVITFDRNNINKHFDEFCTASLIEDNTKGKQYLLRL